MDMSLSKLRGMVKVREAWHAAVHGGHKELNNNNSNKWKDEASSRPYPIGSHNVIFVPDLAKIQLNAL